MRRSIGAARNPESQDAILEAATAILAETGYAGFSIEAVARRAKAGKPTIYRWWPSRAHLLLDVYRRLKDELPEPDTGTLEGDLTAFLLNLTGFWSGPAGSVYRSLLAEAQVDGKAAEALAAYSAERVVHTAQLFERARQRGELRDGVDTRAASDLLSAYPWKLLLTGRVEQAGPGIAEVAKILVLGLKR